ncbi:MAG: histone H1 [Rickettsiales bacterium]|nr:MAG: histone H1 [Rickettsiales bacterium]
MLETRNQLESLIEEFLVNDAKFFEKGNKSAGTRARKALSELSKLSKVRRAEIQEVKNQESK